jgi:magnesium and cobalt exporter, CNNM family
LAPEVAAAAAPLAGRTVSAFRPLFQLTDAIERLAGRLLPRRVPEARGASVRRDLLLGVFSLADTTVEEVMTPRLDIVALSADADWNEAVDVVRRGEHARIPVYAETLDKIAGILYAKDLVAQVAGIGSPPARWQNLVRPAQFVPESKSLAAQLRDFQRGPAHLAVVVDEYGGTSGLITLEDALEEVVGEIHDEYDVDEPPAVEREGDDRFWVDGSVTLDELGALLGFTPDNEDVTTVGGLVYAELGRVPRPGEEFKFAQFRVVVEQVVRRRVRRVYFERLDGSSHDNLVTTGQESA